MYFHQITLLGFSDKILTCNILYIYIVMPYQVYSPELNFQHIVKHIENIVRNCYFYIFTQIVKNQKR